jgi:outer membrane receptor protein involved in Fe transport
MRRIAAVEIFDSRYVVIALCALMAAGWLAQPASGQILYGSIVGMVTDPSGASVPGAQVKIASKATGLTRDATTNSLGLYRFADLPPGSFDVEVTASGFRPYAETGVGVTIDNVIRIDVQLQVGSVSENILVQSEATPLKTDTSDVSVELPSKAVTDLPLPGYRNYQSLLSLVPGASPPGFQNAIIDTPDRALTTHVNGTIRNANNTRSDGTVNILPYLRHHAAYIEPSESVEAVNITTDNFDAEQGLAGGAAITVITKSGTNDLHGTAFWYHDNQHLLARNFFLVGGKPKSIDNIFGGTAGGSIIRNKLFYFGSWEGTRQPIGFQRLVTVPTAGQRAGNFTSFATTIYDPATGTTSGASRQPFPNFTVPLSRQSSITRKIQDLVPLPNLEGTVENYFNSGTQAFDRDNLDAKVNWHRTERHLIWGKYAVSNATVDCLPVLGQAGGRGMCSGGSGTGHTLQQMATLGHSWSFGSNLIVDGTVGYSRLGQNVKPWDYGTNFGLDVLGIPGTNGPDIRQSGFPAIRVSGFERFGSPDNWSPLFRNDETYALTSNAGWTRGAHELRFGADMRRYHVNHWQPEMGAAGPRGRIDFAGGITSLAGGPSPNQFNSWAAFLLGQPRSVSKSLQWMAPMSTREWQLAWYARDRWQVSPKLTLNLGLRYEYFPLMTRAWMGIERYDPATNQVLRGRFDGVPDNAGTTVSGWKFAPRIGVAYRFANKTVFRGGYGITNDPDLLSALIRSPYPAVIAAEFVSPNSRVAYGPIEKGIPAFTGPPLNQGKVDIPPEVATNFLPAGKLNRGYIQSWNVTIERELPYAVVWSLGYVGTASVHQFGGHDVNYGTPGGGEESRQLYAKFGRTAETILTDGILDARYHSLQSAVNRRFSNGLMLKGAYTWGRAINYDDESATDDGSSNLMWNLPSQFRRNRALAGYDRTHTFQIGWLYELPFGPGKKMGVDNPVVRAIARDWQVNGTLARYSGTPFTIGASDASLDSPSSAQTADQVKPNVEKFHGVGPGVSWFDPLAFRDVTDVRFGNTGRNILRGPGVFNMDLGLFRSFQLAERLQMQFRAEAFHATNTPQFGNPGTDVSNMQLNPDGTIRNLGGFSEVRSAGGERQFRFGLRLSF